MLNRSKLSDNVSISSLYFVMCSHRNLGRYLSTFLDPFDNRLMTRYYLKWIVFNMLHFDLIEDVQFLIIDSLDFNHLINLVEACPELHNVATWAFRKKNKDFIFHFAEGNLLTIPGQADFTQYKKFPCISIYNLPLMLRVLKLFGSAIQHLEVDNTAFIDDDANTIIEYINKYTTESWTVLKLHYLTENTLMMFTVPFENVENLFIGTEILKRI